ncbi:hypothetical protein MLD38_037139 [Melastoma candidum]|uniref:Uncharacterized protein n=1 Tax=Melastoma candidum TaxID=119954 RepID=A0ACB9LML5_9MYRT|nr:hypothetical protein MLD38_037139 [Melastoma candidum]
MQDHSFDRSHSPEHLSEHPEARTQEGISLAPIICVLEHKNFECKTICSRLEARERILNVSSGYLVMNHQPNSVRGKTSSYVRQRVIRQDRPSKESDLVDDPIIRSIPSAQASQIAILRLGDCKNGDR